MTEQKTAWNWLGVAIYNLFVNLMFLLRVATVFYVFYSYVRDFRNPVKRPYLLVATALILLWIGVFSVSDCPLALVKPTHFDRPVPAQAGEEAAWPAHVAIPFFGAVGGSLIALLLIARRRGTVRPIRTPQPQAFADDNAQVIQDRKDAWQMAYVVKFVVWMFVVYGCIHLMIKVLETMGCY